MKRCAPSARRHQRRFGDALGKLYVAKHFLPHQNAPWTHLLMICLQPTAERIKKLDWMSAGTKRKALIKLKSMNRKIATCQVAQLCWLKVSPQDYYGK